jgi:hypothetical protein
MGALRVTGNTTLNVPPDGVFHYTTINIDDAVVTLHRNTLNTPVYLLAQGEVRISGWLVLSGRSALQSGLPYGLGGPGGFDGGMAGTGGATPTPGGNGKGRGGGSLGVGGTLAAGNMATNGSGSYGSRYLHPSFPNVRSGAMYGSPLLIPLVGGSGGGAVDGRADGGGGGGGGAILIASNSKISFGPNGRIYADGGEGVHAFTGGSGGAIRLVAPLVVGPGRLNVDGGTNGGAGRIRIDSIHRVNPENGNERPQFAFSPNADVATMGSNMIVLTPVLPRLDILQAAGQAIAEGSTNSVLVTLPPGTSPKQTVVVQARNFGRTVPVRVVLTPDTGDAISYDAQIDNTSANPASTVVNVSFPTNVRVDINAWTR